MLNHHIIWEKWLSLRSPKEKQTVDYFVNLICSSDHHIYPKISYGASFLYRYGPLGYFNADKQGLYFGFYWGKLLLEASGSELFEVDDKKMVKIVRLEGKMHDEEFLGNLLLILDEAIKIDDKKYGKKHP